MSHLLLLNMDTLYLRVILCFLFSVIFNLSQSATYTTTAVAGTWDIGGSPGATDNIIVNHNWSGYGGFGTIANYSGTMTINNGGWLKLTGDFTNFSGNINIVSGGTFYVTGSVTTASEAFGGSITINGTWRVNGSFSNGFCTIAGTGYIRVDGAYSGGCNGSVTLPVELIAFDAHKEGKKVNVEWSTASETNSAYYSITRSTNGIDFFEIGRYSAAGNSNSILHYHFKDETPEEGISYYQLVEYDWDGQFQKSKIVTVDLNSNGVILLRAFPNPTSGMSNFEFSLEDASAFSLSVFDVLGREVCVFHGTGAEGKNIIELSMPSLADGQYHVRLSIENVNTSSVLLIKN